MTEQQIGRVAESTLDLRRLQQFVAVVEAGSLTDAATQLGVTQQGLSASMRVLEGQLGVQLFTRTKGMKPSPAGERLYEAAQFLLAGADRTMADVRAVGGGKPATIRVGHSPAVSSVAVYDAISAAIAPDMSMHLFQDYPQQLLRRLMSGDLDIGLRRGAVAPEGLEGAVIGFEHLNIAMQTKDAPDVEEVNLVDLAEHELIVWAPDSQYASFLVAQNRRLGYEPRVAISRFQGLDPVAAPLTEDGVHAMVVAPPGSYFDNRIRVIKLADRICVPLQALWLPAANGGPVGAVIEQLRAREVTPTAS